MLETSSIPKISLFMHDESRKSTPVFLNECTFAAAIQCTCLLALTWIFFILDISLRLMPLFPVARLVVVQRAGMG